MLASTHPYEYDQLPPGNIFRYLILQPGTGNEPLKCSLRTAPIAEIDYVALSYVWGHPAKNHTVICEQHVMYITENLSNALHRLRSPNQSLIVWADSICINQTNHDEKAHQVALIGSIYRAAQRVLLYMGPEDDGAGSTLCTLITKVEQMIRETCDTIDMSWDTFPVPNEDDTIMADPGWDSLRTLLSQSWFDRGWVVQEAALARHGEVIWGQSSFGWDGLMLTYLWLSTRGTDIYNDKSFSEVQINSHTSTFVELHKDIAQVFYSDMSWGKPSVLKTLNCAKELDVTNLHDRIYAFMELPGQAVDMFPDYDRSYLETYYQFALHYIKSTETTELLDYISHDAKSLTKIPSWVPRWDITTWSLSQSSAAASLMNPLNDSSVIRPVIDPETETLHVQGVIFDSVYYASDMFEWETTTPDTFRAIWNRVKASDVERPYALDDGTTLLLDAFLDSLSSRSFDGDFADWRKHRTSFSCDAQITLNQTGDDDLYEDAVTGAFEGPNTYYSLIRDRTHNRKFVLTKRGYMGLAPSITQEGDVCGIVFGCKTPCILRPVTVEEKFRYVGATTLMAKGCYDATDGDGVMFCDVLGEDDGKDWLEWDVEEQTISIC